MKEELIRIEHGVFRSDTGEYRFDISVSCGECIGVYAVSYTHLTLPTTPYV